MKSVHVIRSVEVAAAVLDPIRLRVLSELVAGGEQTGAALARRVTIPRQLVNYHVRALEAAGLVVTSGVVRRGSATERRVRAVAERFSIDPSVLGALSAGPPGGEVPAGVPVEPAASFDLACATAQDLAAFEEDAAAELRRLAAEYHAPVGEGQARATITLRVDHAARAG
ncbi:MAG: helix-turn-helix transcriptional regulator [Phycisphaerae bacterium]|nr:helix-turn-helix transcriptional regulator [Phycisphaerae bacterium]